ncbi:DegT/DnrJ/EryC1/StrS family aminotransferase [Niabella sp. CC-SYL272]|uniref:DegT/DnrJ/EryC1/StrS family aminotransferase n=1 Tax=Niabella agricola TaxID=2891571 RepID=UPI001F281B58|nr:DegT/DnrJ/EryC1/StrS family aminotransferase [Niabella agricola]MCF3108754.1 DegT/DnrJ/EryC1/StrS family aminotransferase [Niabella agricola]
MNNKGRRSFIKKSAVIGLGATLSFDKVLPTVLNAGATPAVLGGTPLVNAPWPKWPIWNKETDEPLVLEALRSGVWSRAEKVTLFEKKWAALIGAKRALTTVNGTNALITAVAQSDIGGGDEVILPPYTFIATLTAVLNAGAMPVFADINPDTFLIDPEAIKKKITPRTRAILPVHICGLPADMGSIMQIAKQHDLVVIEDACQAWLAEINNKKVGTFGHAGCFSFQNSKNLPIGEGGAIVSDDEAFMDRCVSYHNLGLPYGTASARPGSKLRLTEYQAAIGMVQMERLLPQTATRNENAGYLRQQMKQIKGIVPHTLNAGVTKAAYHLFPFRYDKRHFADLSKAQFIKALQAEGVPCSGGYTPLNTVENLGNTFETKNYKKMYSAPELSYERFKEHNQCPRNEQLCQEAVWLPQNVLLANRESMDMIVSAIQRIQKNAAAIGKKGG